MKVKPTHYIRYSTGLIGYFKKIDGQWFLISDDAPIRVTRVYKSKMVRMISQ